ncbi:hypothetical protein OESDEN_20747 [Oesophagostomum dentatum]|uniref:Uncharacterized protein n=1 Tax=Oesophagostomum dentatum TaxID=61180 RepID=A0A0B1S6T9_OESDE|nr:hypothetical protein OESDEN_20747 [Oesophagostomum dentatum]
MRRFCLLFLLVAASRRTNARIAFDIAEEFPSMDFSDLVEEKEEEVTSDPPAISFSFNTAPVLKQFVTSTQIEAPQMGIPAGIEVPFVSSESLLSSLLPYNTIPFFNHPLARTELYNAARDFSRENGHLSETEASFDTPPVMAIASAQAIPTAPDPAMAASPKFPTLLNTAVQQKLFAKKTAARRKFVKNIKL